MHLEVVMAGRFGDEEIVEAFLYLMASCELRDTVGST